MAVSNVRLIDHLRGHLRGATRDKHRSVDANMRLTSAAFEHGAAAPRAAGML